MNHKLPDIKVDSEKAEEPEIKLPASVGSLKKQESSRKTTFALVITPKPFDCVDHNKQWKILQEIIIPDHLTCLLKNLYAGQEATVRTGHETTDWFQIRKRVSQGCTQAGIKIARRNINNLRYAADTTLVAESEEELRNLLMKVKE